MSDIIISVGQSVQASPRFLELLCTMTELKRLCEKADDPETQDHWRGEYLCVKEELEKEKAKLFSSVGETIRK